MPEAEGAIAKNSNTIQQTAERHSSMTSDTSWMPANYGSIEPTWSFGSFSGELRLDTSYHYSLAAPKDNSISGSSEVFRHNEFQLTHIGIGGDFVFKNIQARLMTQFGLYSQTTPRNDASPKRGQWQLDNAYRYISEAYAGYHLPILAGINIQTGIFMSYLGLWSYYNFDNWTYQPSYVSSNTPWFFNGLRIQIFVTPKLKIEPWIVNGWQSYGSFNKTPGLGLQVAWHPNEGFALVSNAYVGADTLALSKRLRFHSDSSVMWRYYQRPGARLSKAAISFTFDGGFESGDGVQPQSQYFLGAMAYHRLWLFNDMLGLTLGGGLIQNPGRYLVLLPPINGATAASGTPFFTTNPKDPFRAWDFQVTIDLLVERHATLRLEYTSRHANVPYFAGPNGMTPPSGNDPSDNDPGIGWTPDLTGHENRFTLALLIKL